jgi:hypothetical protein
MNGYSYNGAYDGSNMDQGEQGNGDDMMMMGQDGMGGGMMGGQSLDEIVNQNAKAMRRQSMPQQYGGTPHNMEDMRRISMMEYGSESPAAQLGQFQFGANPAMNQAAMMSGSGTPGQNQPQRPQARRQSQGSLALNTAFGNQAPNFNAVMSANAGFQQSPHPQSGFDVSMESPYMDSGLGMAIDYNIDQNLGGASAGDMGQMNMYSQAQFSQPVMASPMPHSGSQNTPHATQAPSQDPGGGSGMNTQYSNHTHSSGSTARHLSRSQSLHVPDMQSPAHSGGITPMSQPRPTPTPNHANVGFQGQPQNPTPGSANDRGMGNASNVYDGVNGPVPVNANNYNPNSQGFNWEAPEGGWPSTMVNRPHMHTSYKNAYSSTGFDMLGVLVGSI